MPGETAAPGHRHRQDRHTERPDRRHEPSTSPSTRSTPTGTSSTRSPTPSGSPRPTPTPPCPPTPRSSRARKTFAVTAKTAGTATFTSTDITDGSKTANTSPRHDDQRGRLREAAGPDAGRDGGARAAPRARPGRPTAQTAGTSFNVTVNAVDANWNPVSATDTVALSTSDANAIRADPGRPGRRHEDVRDGAHHGRLLDGHRDRPDRRHEDREHEPPDDGQRRRVREAAAPDARRDRGARHRHRQDRRARPLRPRARASTSPSTPSTRTGTWSARTDTVGITSSGRQRRPCPPTRRWSPAPRRSP